MNQQLDPHTAFVAMLAHDSAPKMVEVRSQCLLCNVLPVTNRYSGRLKFAFLLQPSTFKELEEECFSRFKQHRHACGTWVPIL